VTVRFEANPLGAHSNGFLHDYLAIAAVLLYPAEKLQGGA